MGWDGAPRPCDRYTVCSAYWRANFYNRSGRGQRLGNPPSTFSPRRSRLGIFSCDQWCRCRRLRRRCRACNPHQRGRSMRSPAARNDTQQQRRQCAANSDVAERLRVRLTGMLFTHSPHPRSLSSHSFPLPLLSLDGAEDVDSDGGGFCRLPSAWSFLARSQSLQVTGQWTAM